jgi:hydrogenase maturation protease
VTVVVACFGNVLRGDDGFGVAVAEHLDACGVPDAVRVLDIGIGGIHLVHQLDHSVDALVVVDAVSMGRAPGTVVTVRPDVEDVRLLEGQARRDALADMHYATPERALMLARALGVLPDRVLVVGCEPDDVDVLRQGLSPPIAHAVAAAAAEVRSIVRDLGVDW